MPISQQWTGCRHIFLRQPCAGFFDMLDAVINIICRRAAAFADVETCDGFTGADDFEKLDFLT